MSAHPLPVIPTDLAHRQRRGKNFRIDERVRFHSTTDPELDGFGGIVLGKSIDDLIAFYIILLDRPHSRGDKAVSMPEVCLEHDEIEITAQRA
jgi:hypothetical protein